MALSDGLVDRLGLQRYSASQPELTRDGKGSGYWPPNIDVVAEHFDSEVRRLHRAPIRETVPNTCVAPTWSVGPQVSRVRRRAVAQARRALRTNSEVRTTRQRPAKRELLRE